MRSAFRSDRRLRVGLFAEFFGPPAFWRFHGLHRLHRLERATVIQYWKFGERTQRKDEQGKAVRDQAGNPPV
jgi:hypothetical protein